MDSSELKMEMVPDTVSEKDVREESYKRAAKCGYCTRYGESTCRTKIMNHGFGESKLNIWPRDKAGNLI